MIFFWADRTGHSAFELTPVFGAGLNGFARILTLFQVEVSVHLAFHVTSVFVLTESEYESGISIFASAILLQKS